MINKAEEIKHVNNIYWLSIIVVYKTDSFNHSSTDSWLILG